jgi:hypothetical protein
MQKNNYEPTGLFIKVAVARRLYIARPACSGMLAKKGDLAFLFAWPIAAAVVSFAFHVNFFVGMLLFLAVPSLFLALRNPRAVPKTALFAAVTCAPFAVVIDYVMESTGGWVFPNSIFGAYRLFGVVVIDQIIWTFLYFFFVVIFYETFLDAHKRLRIVDPHLKYLCLLGAASLTLFVTLYFTAPKILLINYFFLKIGLLISVIPVSFVVVKWPRLTRRMLLATVYFFGFTLLYELTAVTLGHWRWPALGQVIGFITILGVSFPVEEFLFWILLGAAGTIAVYHAFDDDAR